MRRWNATQPAFVTRALIGLNVAVFLWTGTGGASALGGGNASLRQSDLAIARYFLQQGEWWRVVTAGFLHFGLLHIAMNMLLLYQLGNLLEPVVGRDNLRVAVTTDVDFTQSEATSEQFRPNQGDQPAAVRSQQMTESSNQGNTVPAGVPGAATNQPPVPAQAPINGASAPLQAAYASTNGGNSKKESVTNYEVDKTVRVTRNATGMIKRVNAAVVVNYRTATDAKGKTSTNAPTQEELDKLTALVQEAVGYDKDRGDSVRVVAAPFQAPEIGRAHV